MVRRTLFGLLALCLLAPAAGAGVPDLILTTATCAASERVSVYSLPDGSGQSLDDCYIYGGARTDATITVTVLDSNGDPIYNYPNCDMWLWWSLDSHGAHCPGPPICADNGTDYDGTTTISGPLWAGGHSDPDAGELCLVFLNGSALAAPGFDIQFNSPDINGDLVVNLTDVVLFAADYYGAYDYRSDFYWDGDVNLSDIVLLAQGMGALCP
jgi:hypothetical protein